MQDLTGKITGSTLTAAEWNQLPQEIQNAITALGIALGSGDLNQLGKAIAGYVANGTFYTDSGAADAYVLTQIGSKQAPTAYTDGFEISFLAGNPNTGASTVNVAGLGVKSIKLSSGSDPGAGDITGRTRCVFDTANDRFELIRATDTGKILQVVTATKADTFTTTNTSQTAITGLSVNITPASTANKVLLIAHVSTVSDGNSAYFLTRGGSNILQGDAAGSRTRASAGRIASNDTVNETHSINFEDSPASVAAQTYQIATSVQGGGTVYVNRGITDADNNQNTRTTSTLIAMEIAG